MTAPELLRDRTEPIAEPLDEALERLTNNTNMDILGHGTPAKEFAESIFKTGVKSTNRNLYETAVPLPNINQDQDAVAKNKALIEGWPHRNAKYVVILGVTRPSEEHPGYHYLQSIVQPDPEQPDDGYYSETGVIPNRFVAGYFDTTNDTFVHNPDFDPHYDPALYQTTADGEIRRILDWVDPRSTSMGSAAVKHAEPEVVKPSVTSPEPLSDDDHVW